MMSVKTILFTSLYCQAVIASLDHHSAIFKQIQTIEKGLSPADMITCAFHAMNKTLSGFRVTDVTGQCEGLYYIQMTSEPFPSNFEYYEKEAHFTTYSRLKGMFMGSVSHLLYSEVKLRDNFQFVLNKSNTDRFVISFQDNDESKLVIFQAYESDCNMFDRYDGVAGEAENKPYEFSAFKVYNVTFEVLESYWQIYIDGNSFTTFAHRHLYKNITSIGVRIGPHIDYLTKYEDPKLPI